MTFFFFFSIYSIGSIYSSQILHCIAFSMYISYLYNELMTTFSRVPEKQGFCSR